MTHDQVEALTFADKVVVMYGGEVVQIGTPQELFERPGHTFVGYFIGSPGHELPARRGLGRSRALVDGARASARARPTAEPPKGQRVQIGVRPEYVAIVERGRRPVQVRRVEDLGRKRLAYVALGGQLLVGHHPPEMSSIGDRRTSCSIRRTSTSMPTTFA